MRIRSAILILAAALAACADDPTGPKVSPAPEPPRALGLVEITFSRLGTGEMTATVTPAGLAPGASRSVSAVPGAVPGGTIQLGLRTTSTVDAGGQRYLQAVFRVRNATADGTPNARVLRNVTFIPVSTSATIPGTPVLRFLKQDGSPADPALAAQLKPTGAVADNGSGGLASQYPDVLQAYTEDEVAAIDMSSAPAVTNRFPYGFVTRRVENNTTRDLPASPAPEQFDGAVTFGYRFPTQSSAANNPFTISILALAVEDDVTRITQSIEEQGGGQAAFEARAASLNASQARIFPGGAYNGPIPHIVICSVRTAGTRESPTAHIGSGGPAFVSLSPNPYAGSFIARDAELSATFSRAVSGGAPNTFAVHAFQAGGSFLNGGYRDDEPNTLTYTHVGPFFPGEEVEVSLTGGVTCTPHVARYRVATGPASGRYVGEQFPLPGAPAAVLVRDLDGDGDLDVATGGAGGVTVLRADGTGRFAPPVQFNAGGVPVSLAAGDLNGDGRVDLVGANQAINGVSVLINDGSGGYTTSILPAPAGPRSVTLGDVNGDGRLDIITANNSANTVSVLLALAGGGFGPATSYPSGRNPTFVALSDISGDANLDIVVASGGSNIGVLRGNGAGGFAAVTFYPVAVGLRSFALGDLNGDGRTDLLASNGSVLLGNAAGGFTAGTRVNGINTPSLALVDLNGDGRLDAVTSDVRVLLGTGTGTFVFGEHYNVGRVPQAVAVGDLTGDGRPDAVTANAMVPTLPATSSNSVSLLVGNGSGGFAAASPTAGTVFADVNGDGRLDGLSVAAGVGRVYLGNGSGGIVSVTEFPAQGRARELATGDVNNDGHLDVVTANAASNNVGVHLGDGSGSFPAPTLVSNFDTPWTVALGDVNADGNLDIVTANYSLNYVSVALGDGNGAFGVPTSLLDPGPVRAQVALGDMNNDGRLDIVVSKGRVLLGDGKGGFVFSASFSPGSDARGVALGDVNGDGRLDVAAVALGANKVTVLLGNGAGGFSSQFDRPTGASPIEVALGDLNGDGRLDIATANSTANSVGVLLNDGSGAFPETRYYISGASGSGPFHIALGDMNGDERLDIMTDQVLLFGQAP